MKSEYRLILSVVFFCMVALTACEKKHLYRPEREVTLDDYFDFATTRTVKVNLDYGVKGRTLFEIYGENPLTLTDGQLVKRTDVIALEKGFTNEDGSYSMKSSLPASVREVYIYSPYFNVPTLYRAGVSGDEIRATIDFNSAVDLSTITMTKAVSSRPIGWETIKKNIPLRLADWNTAGTPQNIGDEEAMVIDEMVNRYISKYLPEGIDNKGAYTDSPDITLYKETSKVTFYYAGGRTKAKSVFAYYCYPQNATVDQIREAARHACVIFANVSPEPVLKSGAAMRLKYITPAGEVTEDNFPAGTNIGFLLWNNGWFGGNSNFANDVFYSTKKLNKNEFSCTALLKIKDDKGNEHNMVGFEDWPGGDKDYNDVIFAIKSNPADAIEVPPVPEPEPELVEKTYQGILGFEDNWPDQGDYDMNDVVVKYNSSMLINADNEIVSVADRFTLVWSGANYKDGFGFQYPFTMEGKKVIFTNGGSIKDNVVTLFTNAKKELNVENIAAVDMEKAEPKEASYTVTVNFEQPISKEGVNPPYNPFITVNGTANEVHLTNHAPTANATNVYPTGKADIADGVDTWFVCKDGFPFAIHMDARKDASMMNLNLKHEGVRINETYPKFTDWAERRDPTIKWW